MLEGRELSSLLFPWANHTPLQIPPPILRKHQRRTRSCPPPSSHSPLKLPASLLRGQTGILSHLGNTQVGNDWDIQPLAARWGEGGPIREILFPNVYKNRWTSLDFHFEVGPNIDVVGVCHFLLPTGRHTHSNPWARYQHIQSALKMYFLSL